MSSCVRPNKTKKITKSQNYYKDEVMCVLDVSVLNTISGKWSSVLKHFHPSRGLKLMYKRNSFWLKIFKLLCMFGCVCMWLIVFMRHDMS